MWQNFRIYTGQKEFPPPQKKIPILLKKDDVESTAPEDKMKILDNFIKMTKGISINYIYRCKRGDIIMTHKLLNSNSPLNKPFQLDQSARTRGHSLKLYQKRAATRLCNNFFTNRIVSLWNLLTKEAVTTPSTAAFKRAIDGEWSSKLSQTE